MLINKIEVASIAPKELKKGYQIINVGIVISTEEYDNGIVIELYCSRIGRPAINQLFISKYQNVQINSWEGTPVIYRTDL